MGKIQEIFDTGYIVSRISRVRGRGIRVRRHHKVRRYLVPLVTHALTVDCQGPRPPCPCPPSLSAPHTPSPILRAWKGCEMYEVDLLVDMILIQSVPRKILILNYSPSLINTIIYFLT